MLFLLCFVFVFLYVLWFYECCILHDLVLFVLLWFLVLLLQFYDSVFLMIGFKIFVICV